MSPYHVKAEWDADAEVWVASSDDVPGTRDRSGHVRVPGRKAEGCDPRAAGRDGLVTAGATEVPFEIVAERTEHAKRVS